MILSSHFSACRADPAGENIDYPVELQDGNRIRLEMATALITNTGMYFSTRYTETFLSIDITYINTCNFLSVFTDVKAVSGL